MMRVIAALLTIGTCFDADYATEIAQWRAQREAELKADDGWLTVVGLHWLKEGENRVGSDPNFEVALPASAPKRVGSIVVKAGQASFIPVAGVPMTLNGGPANAQVLKANTDILALGRLKFFIIRREDRLGVRVKDNDSAFRREFTGLHWYPPSPAWRIAAHFTPWDKPRTIVFDTAVGIKEEMTSPGYVTFHKDGREYRLEPVLEGRKLFFVIRDQTSGKTTYGASRFLYADTPKDSVVWLDFNKAINPPCAFTPYATCPLPPPQNRLPFAVNAGEQKYQQNHP